MLENVVLCMLYAGVLQFTLPYQVELLNPEDKVNNLGLVTAIGAVLSLVSGPIIGALSDQTRCSLGRRSPWLFFAALATPLCLAALAFAHTLSTIALGVALIQILLTGLGTIVAVVIPERVPVAHRGGLSSWLGLAGPIGTYLGTAIAVYFLRSPLRGCLTFSAITVITTLALAVLCREAPPPLSETDGFPRFAPLAFFSSFAMIDFRWVFISRFLILAAFCLVSGYQLYLLQDYVARSPGKTPLELSATLNIWLSISMTLAGMVAGTASDRLRRRNVLVFWSAIAISIATVLPLLLATTGGMFAYSIASGLGLGCYFAVDTALVADVLPDNKNGARDMGILNTAAAAPQILTPVLGVIIVNHLRGYTALLLTASLLAILSAVAIRAVRSIR